LLDRADGRISREEFEERQAALDAVLVDKKVGTSEWPLVAAVIGAGAVTAAAFAWLGSGASVTPVQPATQMAGVTPPSPGGGQLPPKQGGDLRDLAKPLAQKLAEKPDDGAGWLLLARTYVELHQFKEASASFEKASKLVPGDAQMLADWAAALVSDNNGMWTPAARDILKKALALDSNNPKVLTLAAAEASSRNDVRQAEIYRKQIATLAPDTTRGSESNLPQTPGRSGSLPVLPKRSGN
jgi:cytochrome c-type biogenesis protein CcmH/NrfG